MRSGIDIWMLLLAVFALVLAMLAHEYKHQAPRLEFIVISRDAGLL